MSTPRRAPLRPLGWALCALLGAVPVAAQAPAPGLTLTDVVRATLERNLRIEIAEQRLAGARGAHVAASGLFSTQLATSAGSEWENRSAFTPEGTIANQPLATSSSYSVGLTRRFRSGLVVQPEVAVARSRVDLPAAVPTSSATVGVALLLPLLEDRGGALSAAGVRAAEADYGAEVLSLRHSVSSSVLDGVSAYWSYLAAVQRARVYASSESRAQRMLEETRVLVAAEERSTADLNQLHANAVSKRIGRIAAEQAVVQARHQLALIMGVGAADLSSLAAPSDSFPAPVEPSWDAAAEQRLVETALARRADLAAMAEQQRSSEVLLRAARSELRPKLDLSVSLGYAGLGVGEGLERVVAPLYENVPGLSSTVQLQYRLPFSNAEARGRAMQRAAASEQQRLAEIDLRRRITAGVRVAMEAVRRSVETVQAADDAVRLYQTTVENERKKHQLGAATLFDVILAEDGLTNAMLSQVAARLEYAQTVGGLRFETGTLLLEGGGAARVDEASLVTPP